MEQNNTPQVENVPPQNPDPNTDDMVRGALWLLGIPVSSGRRISSRRMREWNR